MPTRRGTPTPRPRARRRTENRELRTGHQKSRYATAPRIDWPVSQEDATWISTTLPNRPSTAPRCARGSSSTGTRRPSCAARARSRTRTRPSRAHRAWQRKLAEAGYVGLTWPKEYGGQGRGPARAGDPQPGDQRAAGVPGILDSIGVGMLGPTIIAHGTEEQKQRYLAPMLHADEVWCQLFSEPAAGLRPGRHPDPRQAPGRRQLAAVGPEGVDDQRPVRLVRPAARAHGP